ncbi:16720_t:CDS:2, partial [Rhizophagus irregularis]
MDYFTKWPEARAISNIKAETVVKFINKEIICKHRVSQEILSDRGIPKSTFRAIALKLQIPVRDPDVIAVLTFTLSEIQEVMVPTTNASTPVITKVSKKNNGQKTERASSIEEETGWDDTNTGLLI